MASRTLRRTILAVEGLEDRWLLSSAGVLPPNQPPNQCPGMPPNLPLNFPPNFCGNPPANNPPANNPPIKGNAVTSYYVVVVRYKDAKHIEAEYDGSSGKLHNATEGAMGLTHWVLDPVKGWLPTGTEEKEPPNNFPHKIHIPKVGNESVKIITDEKVKTSIDVYFDEGATEAEYYGTEHKTKHKHMEKDQPRTGDLFRVKQGNNVWTKQDGKWIVMGQATALPDGIPDKIDIVAPKRK